MSIQESKLVNTIDRQQTFIHWLISQTQEFACRLDNDVQKPEGCILRSTAQAIQEKALELGIQLS